MILSLAGLGTVLILPDRVQKVKPGKRGQRESMATGQVDLFGFRERRAGKNAATEHRP
jgi:hypothetical protein